MAESVIKAHRKTSTAHSIKDLLDPLTPDITDSRLQAPLFPDLPPVSEARLRDSGIVVSDDFGSFVSVPPNQDPLSTPLGSADSFGSFEQSEARSSFSPIDERKRASGFFDGAVRATERNQKSVLDELLEHQDDPLYWVKTHSSPDPQGAAGDITGKEDTLLDLVSDLSTVLTTKAQNVTGQLSAEVIPTSNAPSQFKPVDPTFSGHAKNLTSTHAPMPAPAVDPARSGTMSASSSPPSNSPPTTIKSRSLSGWLMSSLRHRSPSNPPSGPTDTLFDSTHSTRNSSLDNTPSSSPQMHSRGHHTPLPTPSKLDITHGANPFAAHTFVPAAGAPGFSGVEEHNWDKGFTESYLNDGALPTVVEGLQEMRPFATGKTSISSTSTDKKGTVKVIEKIEEKLPQVKLVGRRESTTPVLPPELAELLRPHLPALPRLSRTWSLLYSLDQHGISLHTLYSRCEAHLNSLSSSAIHSGGGTGMLLVVKDSRDAIFGAWMGEGIKLEKKGGYFGNGESFLWRYLEAGGLSPVPRAEIFKWTGKNDYIALCESESISFGGGDGHYGLYLDETLSDGSSAPCPTFDNPALCFGKPKKASGTTAFECVGLEVWAIG